MSDDPYGQLFGQEAQSSDEPHGWIQWKGTDVCIDLHCACGGFDDESGNPVGHYDGYQMYAVECRFCGRIYRVMQNVGLVEATTDEQKQYLRDHFPPKLFGDED